MKVLPGIEIVIFLWLGITLTLTLSQRRTTMLFIGIDQHARQQRLTTNRSLGFQRCEDLVTIEG